MKTHITEGNIRNSLVFFTLVFLLFNFSKLASQNISSESDGEWSSYYVNLKNTPQADYMIRFGDIDNLGFGFKGIDPFTGNGRHPYPWTHSPSDSLGLDMIMVSEGIRTTDGYSNTSKKILLNKYGKSNFPITFPLKVDTLIQINSILLQIYFDDLQPLSTNVKYRAFINNRRARFMEKAINTLDLGGPKGKLMSFAIPKEYFDEFSKSEFSFYLQNVSEEYCEGYAIDFIKILYNPKNAPVTKPEEKLVNSLSIQTKGEKIHTNNLETYNDKVIKRNQFFENLTLWFIGSFVNYGGVHVSPVFPIQQSVVKPLVPAK